MREMKIKKGLGQGVIASSLRGINYTGKAKPGSSIWVPPQVTRQQLRGLCRIADAVGRRPTAPPPRN